MASRVFAQLHGLVVFSSWPLPSTALIDHCSAVTPRKAESGKEIQKLRIIFSEHESGTDLMCDLGQPRSPLSVSLPPRVSFE